MKKLVLTLLCIGGILALPSCRDCCDTSCEPCDDVCDDYYDDCDKEDYCDDKDDVWGYEDQGGYRKKIYKSKSESMPRKRVMYAPVHPKVIDDAEAAGKTCTFVDQRYSRQNKKMYKESLGKKSRVQRTSNAMTEEM